MDPKEEEKRKKNKIGTEKWTTRSQRLFGDSNFTSTYEKSPKHGLERPQ